MPLKQFKMRTILVIFFILTGLCRFNIAFSQISYGGKPYFPHNQNLRASAEPYFFEMPSFDLDSVLRDDELNESNMRGAFQFAHKFHTHIEKKQDGSLSVLSDGTKVWTIGIRSQNAYSLNFLLENISIPSEGQLFVYNTDHTHVIGKFDSRNISSSGILPIQPVAGDAVIIEYSEPSDAEFEGNFIISEVNHDYRDFLRREPEPDIANSFLCMPDALCEDIEEELIRATVLLIINGTSACTGALINNPRNDETPYVLTAVHCFNTVFPKPMDYYIDLAGTVITFFNYNRTVCGTTMKGIEEMSLAVTYPRVIAEKKDIALLELRDAPPDYYNAYYAGWNLDRSGENYPYRNLHHPSAAVKKYGLYQNKISISSFPDSRFDNDSHWIIDRWTIGSTYGGSSGSPLFDREGLIVGGLTGGSSACDRTSPKDGPDYFFDVDKAWETDDSKGQLKDYLDPDKASLTKLEGFDPYKKFPIVRKRNADYNSGDELITSELSSPNSGYVFGTGNLNTVEFAEEFYVSETTEIFGAYLILPMLTFASITNAAVSVSIYSGTSAPETLLSTVDFYPTYLKYNSSTGSFGEDTKLTVRVPTENFVLFDQPIKIAGKFFISYRIQKTGTTKFCVYNIQRASGRKNTAWLKENDTKWVPASSYSYYPITTSLAIDVLCRSTIEADIDEIEKTDTSDMTYYDSASGTLHIKNPDREEGYIKVISITGQLIETLKINPGQFSYSLKKFPKGTIGIVKVETKGGLYSTKIIY